MEWDVVHLMHNNLSSGKAMWPFPILFRFDTNPPTGECSPMRVASRFIHTRPLPLSLSSPLSGIGRRRDVPDDSPLSVSLFWDQPSQGINHH